MNQLATKTWYTPDDLLAMAEDGKSYELVDGILVERHMGFWSSWIGGRLYHLLTSQCEAQRLGWVCPADASYQCFPAAPAKVRKPDVSFIRFGRLPGEQAPEGHCRIAPDLAAEVLSPNDLATVAEAKIGEYLQAGVQLLWIVNPEVRTVRVYRPDGTTTLLHEGDELSGEGVVPGFRCMVRDLFSPPAPRP